MTMGAGAESWVLRGEAVVALVRGRAGSLAPPPGIVRLPGPAFVSATRYTDSPVGPFLELAVAEPVRLGSRFGWCRTLVVVDRRDVRTGGRLQWGFPVEVGRLRWLARDDERELVWEDREIVVRGRGRGPAVPWVAFHPTVQERHREPVVVPGRLRGLARVARVVVQTYPGDDLVGLAGHHLGAVVTGLHHVWRPARSAVGLTVPARTHAQAPEPILYERVSSNA